MVKKMNPCRATDWTTISEDFPVPSWDILVFGGQGVERIS